MFIFHMSLKSRKNNPNLKRFKVVRKKKEKQNRSRESKRKGMMESRCNIEVRTRMNNR